MKCTTVAMPDGGTAIVCTSGRSKRCTCGAVATLLCDGPSKHADAAPIADVMGKPYLQAGTCDTPICRACATAIGHNRDLCPTCAGLPRGVAPSSLASVRWTSTPAAALPRCACGALGVRRCCAQPVPGAGLPWSPQACGKPLCDACALPVGPGREQCQEHPR